MAKSKKPKRKYDPRRIRTVRNITALRQYLIAWSVGHKEPIVFTPQGNIAIVPNDIKAFIMQAELPWLSLCVALCRDRDGTQYIETQALKHASPRTYSDLAEPFNDHHHDMLMSCEEDHLLNTGWIASPAGTNISDELAWDIMEKLDSWKYMAKWEKEEAAKCQEPQ